MLRTDGGPLNFWRQIVKKRGFTQDGEYTMQKLYNRLEDMKKKDEKEKMEEMHEQKVAQMIKSGERSAGLLHKITKPTPWRRGAQILDRRRGCEASRPL